MEDFGDGCLAADGPAPAGGLRLLAVLFAGCAPPNLEAAEGFIITLLLLFGWEGPAGAPMWLA